MIKVIAEVSATSGQSIISNISVYMSNIYGQDRQGKREHMESVSVLAAVSLYPSVPDLRRRRRLTGDGI